jgi:hypothetical protein
MEKPKMIESPAYKFEIPAGVPNDVVIKGWKRCGFYIQLHIDHRGYLLDEPKYLNDNDTLVPIDPACVVCPENGSLKDYRVLLFTREDEPDIEDADPVGCRLIGGVWRC